MKGRFFAARAAAALLPAGSVATLAACRADATTINSAAGRSKPVVTANPAESAVNPGMPRGGTTRHGIGNQAAGMPGNWIER